MSMIKSYDKEMTPCRVKTKERQDVDLEKLVKFGAAKVIPPTPVYADLTKVPSSRGEALQKLGSIMDGLKAVHPDALEKLLRLPLPQALEFINSLRAPASKGDDPTTPNGQAAQPQTITSGPSSAGPAGPAAAAKGT